MEFKPWPKIVRVENRRKPFFTEKIDGTNACVVISFEDPDENTVYSHITEVGVISVWAQSRNRFIKPESDNFGFAGWVQKNGADLIALGEGHHFGEWWGLGIGRGYGMDKKVFSLFNARRWGEHNPPPACVSIVPILPVGSAEEARGYLADFGSQAAPGYMNPEGAIMYDPDAECNFKIIINK